MIVCCVGRESVRGALRVVWSHCGRTRRRLLALAIVKACSGRLGGGRSVVARCTEQLVFGSLEGGVDGGDCLVGDVA